MDQAIRNKLQGKPRVLVAPLDWGLGHTTRCIPIIRALLAEGAEVVLAGNDRQSALLSTEFPSLPILSLDGYNIKYASTAAGVYGSIIRQVPRILRAIQKEHEWLKKVVADQNIDAVISDNRFGLYHDQIPSVFMTHQLNIMSGLGTWTAGMLRKKNYAYINRFSECWIPDEKENGGLGGQLSHPQQWPTVPIRYLGPLTRFKKQTGAIIQKHVVILLSGPEPQRSLLEKIMLHDLQHFDGSATLVRGLPGEEKFPPGIASVRIYNHLSADQLASELAKAEFVIARCGYSTIMDLAALEKKSILIPTPGQGEQEYLGKYLREKKFGVVLKQKNFNLQKAVIAGREFEYEFGFHNVKDDQLREVVGDFLRRVSERRLASWDTMTPSSAGQAQ